MSRATGASPQKNKRRKKSADAASDKQLIHGSIDHIIAVLDRLDMMYGFDARPEDEYATGEPLDGLMLTLLSQNTNDRNRDMAYERLRAAIDGWNDVIAMREDDIASLIRPAGLGDTKASRMKIILEEIRDKFGTCSLKELSGWDPQRVREYLVSLRGIGPKTAACVMVFDLGMTAFPVDTHVARLSVRFGWADKSMTPEKIQDMLEGIVPPKRCRGGHLNMIEHGRSLCGARRTDCEKCMMTDLCLHHAKTSDADTI